MNILYVDGHVDSQPILASGHHGFAIPDGGFGTQGGPTAQEFPVTEFPSGYRGGSVTTAYSSGVQANPGQASEVITGGTGSGQGLSGVGLDVGFR